ncbi:MAG: DUF1800 family protein [Pseudomonadota bacterium]
MSSPLVIFEDFHSPLEKVFLDTVIPENTPGEESIDLALDALIEHPNTPPFVSRQLIQRFVTSAPDPDYVERVANVFIAGQYQLPSGDIVGDGRRGDLAATLAAILFDEDARSPDTREADEFGKVREPVLRFTNWARAFDASPIPTGRAVEIWNTGDPSDLGQHPYKGPSVFNFYRPGYIPPASEVGAAGLTAPEFQIVNSSTIAGYANFMSDFISGQGVNSAAEGLIPDYSEEIALADDADALVDHLDQLLAYGTMSDETKETIIGFLEEISIVDVADPQDPGRRERAELAILLVMTSPDYIIQR